MLEYYVEGFTASACRCLGTNELDAETQFLIRFYSYCGINLTREGLAGSDESAEELVQLYYKAMPTKLQEIYQTDLDGMDKR